MCIYIYIYMCVYEYLFNRLPVTLSYLSSPVLSCHAVLCPVLSHPNCRMLSYPILPVSSSFCTVTETHGYPAPLLHLQVQQP